MKTITPVVHKPLYLHELKKAEVYLDSGVPQKNTVTQVFDNTGQAPVKIDGVHTKRKPASLKQFEELCAKYGDIRNLDVEDLAHSLSQNAAAGLRSLYEQLQLLKKEGKLVTAVHTDTVTDEALAALGLSTTPNRFKQHVWRLARKELCVLLCDHKYPAAMRTLVIGDLRRVFELESSRAKKLGLKVEIPQAKPLPLELPLAERSQRMANAAMALLRDKRTGGPVREICIHLLGFHGNKSAVPMLEEIIASAPKSSLADTARVAVERINRFSSMKIAQVSFEMKPFDPGGGLGNYMEEMPTAQARLGHEVKTFTPRHAWTDPSKLELQGTIDVHHPVGIEPVKVLSTFNAAGVEHNFLDNESILSNRKGNVYNDENGASYADNHVRFDFAGYSAYLAIRSRYGDSPPDIVQVNDPHVASAVPFLRNDPYFADTKVVFIQHNPHPDYQQRFDPSKLADMAIGDAGVYYPMGPAELYGEVNLGKLGHMAHGSLQVSMGMLQRILKDGLFGLSGVLQEKVLQGRARGVLNGADTVSWDCATDPLLAKHGVNFDYFDMSNIAKAQALVQQEAGLPVRGDVPLFVVVARLASQKGLDDIARLVRHYRATNQAAQFVVMGDVAEQRIGELMDGLEATNDGVVDVKIVKKFNKETERLWLAAGSASGMTSNHEPGGLFNRYAQRYFTPPIVHDIDGPGQATLDYDPVNSPDGNGFKYKREADGSGIEAAGDRYMQWFKGKDSEKRRLYRNMALIDMSWETSALPEYDAFYRHLFELDTPNPWLNY